jgi:protein ImuA
MLARGEDARDAGAVFARGLAAFGVDPARVLLAHARGGRELLWAAEEAARTKGLGAVLVESGDDARRLDLTASRRLVLAAEESGAAVVLIRMAPVSPPSAAAARFLIAPALSAGDPDDGKAPGAPRWRVAVERFRPDARQAARGAFLAEWRHERKDFDIVAAGAPVPVPLSAVLADGALPAAPSRLLRRGA